MNKRTEIGFDAVDLINNEPQQEYGDPKVMYDALAARWNQYKKPYRPETICLMLTDMKLVRELINPKYDNVRDAIGYLCLSEEVKEADHDIQFKSSEAAQKKRAKNQNHHQQNISRLCTKAEQSERFISAVGART